MQRIIDSLQMGNHCAAVANLQDALQLFCDLASFSNQEEGGGAIATHQESA